MGLRHRMLVLTLSVVGLGCGSSVNTTNALGAAVTAGVAATTWVVAGGCRLQGCPWGTYCDDRKELCVRRSCTEGCPTGAYCNEQIDRCEDMPSVTVMHPPVEPPEADQNLQWPITAPIPY